MSYLRHILPLPYTEALGKIQHLRDALAVKIQTRELTIMKRPSLPLYGLVLALDAAAATIRRLNTEDFSVPVLWDAQADFPTTAVIAADAFKYTELFECPPFLKALLASFSGWTLLQKDQPIGRSRRSRKYPPDKTQSSVVWIPTVFDIMINHGLKIIANQLEFKQLVGVRCEDMTSDALAEYFRLVESSHPEKTRASETIDDLHIIYDYTVKISWQDADKTDVNISDITTTSTSIFQYAMFGKMLSALSIPSPRL